MRGLGTRRLICVDRLSAAGEHMKRPGLRRCAPGLPGLAGLLHGFNRDPAARHRTRRGGGPATWVRRGRSSTPSGGAQVSRRS